MARLVGVDLPRNKRIEIALTYIYGIGLTTSKKVLAETGIDRISAPTTSPRRISSSCATTSRTTSRSRATCTARFPRTLSASWKSVATVVCVIVAACPFAASAHTNARTARGPRKQIGGKRSSEVA